MKKNKATALTAAVFAAAMSASACGNAAPSGEETSERYASPLGFSAEEADSFDPPEPTVAPLYGPPWVLFPTEPEIEPETEPETEYETEPGNDLDEEDPTEPYDPYDVIPQPAYGPPIMMGDVFWDGKVDGFDLAYMRMAYNDGKLGPAYYENYDVNQDGKFDLEDIEAMQKFINGEIEDFYDPSVYTPETEYGPPYIDEDPTEPATKFKPEEEIYPVLYGPPPAYEIETEK